MVFTKCVCPDVADPDKVEPQKEEEAKQLMARINWAKEVLLERG